MRFESAAQIVGDCEEPFLHPAPPEPHCWVAVKELKLSYYRV